MKKYLAFILCIILALSLCACNHDDSSSSIDYEESSSSREPEAERGDGALVVNGKESTVSFKVYQTYAELPLVSVLAEFGYNATWTSDTVAALSNGTNEYTLNLTDKTLIKAGESKSILPLYGNDTYKCEVVKKEVIVDDVTLYDIMSSIGNPITLNLDYDTLTVTINNK